MVETNYFNYNSLVSIHQWEKSGQEFNVIVTERQELKEKSWRNSVFWLTLPLGLLNLLLYSTQYHQSREGTSHSELNKMEYYFPPLSLHSIFQHSEFRAEGIKLSGKHQIGFFLCCVTQGCGVCRKMEISSCGANQKY